MRHILTASLVGVLSLGAVVTTQAATPVPATTVPVAVTTTDPDYAQKLELSKKMNEIRPAKMQVQEAIEQVSANLPPLERDKFMKMVQNAFDYDKLEKTSIETMASLFTVPELQKMVEYFGSPEAKTVGEKLPKYQEKIQPMIIQMMDKAMIEQRTGGEAPPPNMPKAGTAPKIDPNPAGKSKP